MKSILPNVRTWAAIFGPSPTAAKLSREKYDRLSSERSVRYGRSAQLRGAPPAGKAQSGLALAR